MPFSMYQAAVPPLTHTLTALSAILDKAQAHCEQSKLDPAALTTFRLFPDMFPFTRQVQIVTDQAKGCVARLAGIEVPSYADTETTFADLKARLAKTIAFLKSVKREQIDGSETRDIVIKAGNNDLKFKGETYLTSFVLPNFYFHAATAYNILRHCGVALGKRDFLGAV